MTDIMQQINLTAATLTLLKHSHAQTLITVNRAAGTTITLPAATGTGAKYSIYIGTTLTGNGVIQVANATDVMDGVVVIASDINGVTCPTTATSDTITLSGSTTGGILGTRVDLVDVVAGHFAVSGFINSTGTEATPFSAAVS